MAEPAPPLVPPKKELTAQEIAENRKENLIAIVIVIAVLAVVGFFIWHSLTRVAPVPDRINVPLGISPVLGNESAPVTVVIFSDFECPYCGDFARYSFPDVKKNLIDTGKVRLSFRHFPLPTHTHAYVAAQAAACAQDQNMFWEYHDVLYAHQDALEIGKLQTYAADLGLDTELFNDCLASELRAPTVIADRQLGLDRGVAGTPTFFFNGRKVAGALTAAEFAAEVEREQTVS